MSYLVSESMLDLMTTIAKLESDKVELKKRIANEIKELNKYMNTARSIQSKLFSKCNVFSNEKFENMYAHQYEEFSIFQLREIKGLDIDVDRTIKICDDDSDLY